MLFYAYLVFAIFQTTLALPTTSAPPLLEDLSELLPLNEIRELKLKHLNDDPEFQAAVKYFKSPEWKSIVDDVRETPQWIDYKNYIKEAGVDLDYYIQHINHCINATDTTKLKLDDVKPNLGKFLQNLKMTYGIHVLKGLQAYAEKVDKSAGHKKLKEMLLSPKSKQLLEEALKQPALQKLVTKLQEMDINVSYALQMIYSLAGWDTDKQ